MKSVYVKPPPMAGGKKYSVVREVDNGTYWLRVIEREGRFGFALWQRQVDSHAVAHADRRARQEPHIPDPLPFEKVEDADKELRTFVRETTSRNQTFDVPLTFAQIRALESVARRSEVNSPSLAAALAAAVAALQAVREKNGG